MKWGKLILLVALSLGISVAFVPNVARDCSPLLGQGESYGPADMPTVRLSREVSASTAAPIEQRDESVRRYLKVSVRIRNGNISGSGTVCYYDRAQNMAYVITCAHLFRGGERTVQVHAFYKNNVKLASPQTFTAEVIGFDAHQDIGFIKFRPDWIMDEYFRIAPENYPLPAGQQFISTGCDGAREVAAYDVTIVGVHYDPMRRLDDLIIRNNGPRRGRSGGGLLTTDGYYVGICWGSEDPDGGTRAGLFVPLSRIHAYAKRHGLDFLLRVEPPQPAAIANTLPIVDRSGPQQSYPNNYIPLP